MTHNEAIENIKVAVFVLKRDKGNGEMQPLQTVDETEKRIDISVLVRISQKQEYNEKLHLFLVHMNDKNEYSTFSAAEISLNSEGISAEGGVESASQFLRLPKEEYTTYQIRRYNLFNIPLNGKGTYAIVVAEKENDLNDILDAYYFDVK